MSENSPEEEEKERLNKLYGKAFKKLGTLSNGDPRLYLSLKDLDLMECPIYGEVFFGLMDFASHTVKAHNMSATQVWKKKEEGWNPTRR